MVQVGEQTGKTEQALSGLFERQSKGRQERQTQAAGSPLGPSPPAVSHAAPQRPTSRRPVAGPLTHAPLRSLNALLGSTHGPRGRATLPKQSPFEARVRDDQQEGSRPAKRRRNNDESSARNNTARSPTNNEGTRLSLMQQAQVKKTMHGKSDPGDCVEIVDNDSEPRIERPTKTNNRRRGDSHKKVHETITTESRSLRPPTPPAGPSNPVPRPEPPSLPASLPDPPLNPLRLATRPTRKKLLCQPSKVSDRKSPQSDASHVDRTHAPPCPPALDNLARFHHAQQQRLQARQARSEGGNGRSNPPRITTTSHDEYDFDDDSLLSRPEKQPNSKAGGPMEVQGIRQPSRTEQRTVSPTEISRDVIRGSDRPLGADEQPKSTAAEPSAVAAATRPEEPTMNVPPVEWPECEACQVLEEHESGLGELGPAAVEAPGSSLIKASLPADIGPWSREAFDLFAWRPPGLTDGTTTDTAR